MSSSLNHQIIDNEGVPHETIEGNGAANKEATSESSEGTMITAEEMLLFMGKECLRTCAEVSLASTRATLSHLLTRPRRDSLGRRHRSHTADRRDLKGATRQRGHRCTADRARVRPPPCPSIPL